MVLFSLEPLPLPLPFLLASASLLAAAPADAMSVKAAGQLRAQSGDASDAELWPFDRTIVSMCVCAVVIVYFVRACVVVVCCVCERVVRRGSRP